jgi:hypothetical protein
MKSAWKCALACASVVLLLACSGGGGGGDTSTNALSGDWADNNNDGIYDPYQNPSLWAQMNSMTASSEKSFWGPRLAFAAQRRWRGNGNASPGWVDNNGDGICDYAQDRRLWENANQANWVDNNGDGVCDNYPSSSQWRGGWR